MLPREIWGAGFHARRLPDGSWKAEHVITGEEAVRAQEQLIAVVQQMGGREQLAMATTATKKPHGARAGTPGAKQIGQTLREKYGADYFSQIGKRGGTTTRDKQGLTYYAEIGKRGGESTKARHGLIFYSALGRRSTLGQSSWLDQF